MAFDLSTIFSDIGSKVVDSFKGLVTGIVEEFKINPERGLELQQKAVETMNTHLQEMAKIAQEGVESELKAKQAVIDSTNKDIADARAMNIRLQGESPSWLAKNLPYLIDSFITLLYGCATLYIIARAFHVVSNGGSAPDMNLIWGIYAALTGAFTTVLQYHRGSSNGAKVNGDAIREIAKSK